MTAFQHKHTLPDGVEITLGRVSPMLYQDLDRALPKPVAPMNRVDLNFEGEEQPNEGDPEYLKAVNARKAELNELFMRIALDMGVTLPFSRDELIARIEAHENRLRAFMPEGAAINLDRSAPIATYIMRVSGANFDEISGIFAIIIGKSMPTEEAITESIATF